MPELAGQEEPFPEPDNQSKMKRSCENAEHVGTSRLGQHRPWCFVIMLTAKGCSLQMLVSIFVTSNVVDDHSTTEARD